MNLKEELEAAVEQAKQNVWTKEEFIEKAKEFEVRIVEETRELIKMGQKGYHAILTSLLEEFGKHAPEGVKIEVENQHP